MKFIDKYSQIFKAQSEHEVYEKANEKIKPRTLYEKTKFMRIFVSSFISFYHFISLTLSLCVVFVIVKPYTENLGIVGIIAASLLGLVLVMVLIGLEAFKNINFSSLFRAKIYGESIGNFVVMSGILLIFSIAISGYGGFELSKIQTSSKVNSTKENGNILVDSINSVYDKKLKPYKDQLSTLQNSMRKASRWQLITLQKSYNSLTESIEKIETDHSVKVLKLDNETLNKSETLQISGKETALYAAILVLVLELLCFFAYSWYWNLSKNLVVEGTTLGYLGQIDMQTSEGMQQNYDESNSMLSPTAKNEIGFKAEYNNKSMFVNYNSMFWIRKPDLCKAIVKDPYYSLAKRAKEFGVCRQTAFNARSEILPYFKRV